jgi:Lar family restriction alleviation protein
MTKDVSEPQSELLLCPFCGGTAQLSDVDWEIGYRAYVAVLCSKCRAKGEVIEFHIRDNCGGHGSEWRSQYEARAIAAWNTRAVSTVAPTFQDRVRPWLLACFGAEIANDKAERDHRFLEEALELVQACGCTQTDAHQLVDYVYNRPSGDVAQEAGGVMITLASLCLAQEVDMHASGETELDRNWERIEIIRAKRAAKPKHSPLPEHVAVAPEQSQQDEQRYLQGSCTESECRLCHLPDYARQPGMKHSGLTGITEQSQLSREEEALFDEVDRRKDEVVDAAVAWHQSGDDWMETADRLSDAIDSLLSLRVVQPVVVEEEK